MWLTPLILFLIFPASLSSPALFSDSPGLQKMDHWVVFDQVGQMASSVTYLHVALPVNISTLKAQSQIIASVLFNMSKPFPDLKTGNETSAKQTVHKILQDISVQLLYKLDRTVEKLNVIQTIIPKPVSLSRTKRTPCLILNFLDQVSCSLLGYPANKIDIHPAFQSLTGNLNLLQMNKNETYRKIWLEQLKTSLEEFNKSEEQKLLEQIEFHEQQQQKLQQQLTNLQLQQANKTEILNMVLNREKRSLGFTAAITYLTLKKIHPNFNETNFFELIQSPSSRITKRSPLGLLPVLFYPDLVKFYQLPLNNNNSSNNNNNNHTRQKRFVFMGPFIYYKVQYDKAFSELQNVTAENKQLKDRIDLLLKEIDELSKLPDMPEVDAFLNLDLKNLEFDSISKQGEGSQNSTFSNSSTFAQDRLVTLTNLHQQDFEPFSLDFLRALQKTKRSYRNYAEKNKLQNNKFEFPSYAEQRAFIYRLFSPQHKKCMDKVYRYFVSNLVKKNLTIRNLDQKETKPNPGSSCERFDFREGHLFPTDHVFPKENRNKRQIAEMLIGGAVAGLVGTFMGIYSAVEIGKIKDQISQLDEQQQLLIQITNQHDKQIKDLISDLFKLTSVVEALVQYNPTVFYAQLEEQIDMLGSRIDDTIEVIQQLQNHRLSVKLLRADLLLKMKQEIDNQAAVRNLVPLPNKISDYFQLETTFTREGDNLLVLVHVPCVPHEHVLRIFRYVPFPIPLPFPTIQHPHTIHHGLFNGSFSESDIRKLKDPTSTSPGSLVQEGLIVQPEAELIAIGANQHYKILTTAELDGCDKKPRLFLCNRHQVLKTKLSESCLGSMYTRSELGVRQHCKLRKEPLVEIVHQISSSNFLVFSPEDFTKQAVCINGTQFPVAISIGNNEISLPEGCKVTLRSHELLSDLNVRVSSQALGTIWHWSPMLLSFSSLQDPGRHDQYLAEIHDHLLKLKSENNQSHALTKKLSNPSTIPISWWIIIVGIVCVFFIILWCYCWHCTRYCQWLKNCCSLCSSPSPPNSSQGGDTELEFLGSRVPQRPAPAKPEAPLAIQHEERPAPICRHARPYGTCCRR